MIIQDWKTTNPTHFGLYLVTLESIYSETRGRRRVVAASWGSDYLNGQQPHWNYEDFNHEMEKVIAYTELPRTY